MTHIEKFIAFVEATGPQLLAQGSPAPSQFKANADLELRDTALERRALRLCGHCEAPRYDDDTKCQECGARS